MELRLKDTTCYADVNVTQMRLPARLFVTVYAWVMLRSVHGKIIYSWVLEGDLCMSSKVVRRCVFTKLKDFVKWKESVAYNLTSISCLFIFIKLNIRSVKREFLSDAVESDTVMLKKLRRYVFKHAKIHIYKRNRLHCQQLLLIDNFAECRFPTELPIACWVGLLHLWWQKKM